MPYGILFLCGLFLTDVPILNLIEYESGWKIRKKDEALFLVNPDNRYCAVFIYDIFTDTVNATNNYPLCDRTIDIRECNKLDAVKDWVSNYFKNNR